MSTPSCKISASVLPQRIAGAVLVLIPFALIAFDATGVFPNPNASAILLLVVLAIIAFAVHKTAGGMASLIGLFYLGTILWVAPRPLLALVSQNDSAYTLLFGQLASPRGPDLSRLLAFWITGVSSLFGAYFLFFGGTRPSLPPLSEHVKGFCKRSFIVAFMIVAVSLPLLAHKRFVAFATGGYLALYLNQADSSFSLLPLLDYLTPTLYALAVVIGEKRYSRLMIVAVVCYTFCGLLFGRRMEAGTWLLVLLWHFTTIRGKPIRLSRLLVGLTLVGCAFQLVEILRTGTDNVDFILMEFFTSQGVIFMIPALSWLLPPPPIHTIVGSLLSVRHFYRLLGIGSIGTANMLDYISSQSSFTLFESGNGLSTTIYLDIFYICGQVMFLYAILCGLLGWLLCKWELASSRSRVALFFLCACLPSLFFVQRSSLFTVTSLIVYISLFMAANYILSLFFSLIQINEVQTGRIQAGNRGGSF
jgi:hypothetical protein